MAQQKAPPNRRGKLKQGTGDYKLCTKPPENTVETLQGVKCSENSIEFSNLQLMRDFRSMRLKGAGAGSLTMTGTILAVNNRRLSISTSCPAPNHPA